MCKGCVRGVYEGLLEVGGPRFELHYLKLMIAVWRVE